MIIYTINTHIQRTFRFGININL